VTGRARLHLLTHGRSACFEPGLGHGTAATHPLHRPPNSRQRRRLGTRTRIRSRGRSRSGRNPRSGAFKRRRLGTDPARRVVRRPHLATCHAGWRGRGRRSRIPRSNDQAVLGGRTSGLRRRDRSVGNFASRPSCGASLGRMALVGPTRGGCPSRAWGPVPTPNGQFRPYRRRPRVGTLHGMCTDELTTASSEPAGREHDC
jgi:hypothetical protein